MDYLEFLVSGEKSRVMSVSGVSRGDYAQTLTAMVVANRLSLPVETEDFTGERDSTAIATLSEYAPFAKSRVVKAKGISRAAVERVRPPLGTVVVVLHTGGETIPSVTYQSARLYLKLFTEVLALKKHGLYDRRIYGLPWYTLREPSEMEALLRKAVAAGWSFEKLQSQMNRPPQVILATDYSRPRPEHLETVHRLSYNQRLTNRLVREITEVESYRELISYKMEPAKALSMMSRSASPRMIDLYQSVIRTYSSSSMTSLAKRLIQLTTVDMRRPDLAPFLALYGSPSLTDEAHHKYNELEHGETR